MKHKPPLQDGPPEDRDSTDASKRQLGASDAAAHPEEADSPTEEVPLDPDATRLFRPGARFSGLGSGLMARVPTPPPEQVAPSPKICPHCGAEYETGARFCPNDGASLRPKVGIDPLVGRILAERYHVLKVVAEGGMGRVYLAEHVRMNRQCAIKVMRPALVEDPDSAARFAREASNAARIIHPNVAAVFDYGESEGLVFLVMEFVEGEPLGEVIQREKVLHPKRAHALTCQVADALIAAHELGIIHRDLKPDNILVTRMKSGKEVAKVVDFGIAKAVADAPHQQLTGTGLVIGTPEFMAPEQLLGDPADARSDIYALGCITYLMLTGVPVSDAPTREGMLKRRLHEPAPHARAANPEVPAELDAVVAKMLASSPADRWQSAAELKEALEGIRIAGPPTEAIPAAPRITPRSVPTVAFETPRASRPIRRPRRRWPIAVAIAAVAVAVGATQYFLSSRRTAPPPVVATRAATPAPAPADSIKAAPVAVVQAPGTAPVGGTTTPASSPAPVKPKPAPARPSDSGKGAAAAGDEAAPALPRTPTGLAIRAPIERIASAIESRDIARVQAAWPGLTPSQRAYWERNVFALAEALKAGIVYTGATLRPGGTEVDFTLRVRFRYRNGEVGNLRPQHLHAVMSRRGGAWHIDQLSER